MGGKGFIARVSKPLLKIAGRRCPDIATIDRTNDALAGQCRHGFGGDHCHAAFRCGIEDRTRNRMLASRFDSSRNRQKLKLAPPAKRSEEHTSELQSLMRISYAVFCLKKKKTKHTDKQA